MPTYFFLSTHYFFYLFIFYVFINILGILGRSLNHMVLNHNYSELNKLLLGEEKYVACVYTSEKQRAT